MISTVVGVTAFLALLLFATQLALNLYATSTVTATAFDAARVVAGAGGGPDAEEDAEARVRSLLDGYEELDLIWTYSRTSVSLRVEAEHPTRLLRALPLPFQHFSRTVTVRIEAFQ